MEKVGKKVQNKNNNMANGLFWKLMERFGVQGTQFLLSLYLARILAPEHYGALSMMVIFTSLATVFIEGGLNTSLIQNKDVTEEDYSSIFWVSLTVAAILYSVIFLATPAIAAFYRMPEIIWPLRVLALMLLPGALNSVQLAKISRKMDFKKVFYSNVGGILIAGAAGIVLAKLGGGLWALVAQRLLNTVVTCIVMFVTVKWRPRFVCNFQRVKILFRFGWKILISRLLDTLYADLNSLVIGRKYNSSTLAYYNRGKHFPQFIINSVNGAVRSVMLPAMSAQQNDKGKLKQLMRNSMTMSAYIIFPMMAGLAAVATPLVRLLLTDKWLPCVPYLQVYCFSQAFYPIHSCNVQAINAMGRSDLFLKLEIIKKCYGIVALAIAVFCFDSPLAIAMTGLITTWISWFVNAFPNKRLIGYSYKEQIFDLFPILFMALGMCGLVLLVGSWCQRAGMLPLVTMIVQIIVGVAVYLVLSMILKPSPYGKLMNQIKSLRKRK